jgi:transcriptional regulator with XRE-family HTH domain
MRGYSYEFIKRIRALAKKSKAPQCARLGLLAIERGISITTIAKQVGVSRMAVYDWFTGKYEPTEGNLRKLEKCVNGN